MPKETIRSSTHSMFDVELRWGRDSGDVQIATVVPPAQTGDAPASLGALIDGWGSEERYVATGLHADLTRADCNRLIRALRTARDQAFGRDE